MGPAERLEACECAVVALDDSTVMVGADKAFTFNYAFAEGSGQGDVFDACVRPLVLKCIEGYNATVFAYGQTVRPLSGTHAARFPFSLSPAAANCTLYLSPSDGLKSSNMSFVRWCPLLSPSGLWQNAHHGGQRRG